MIKQKGMGLHGKHIARGITVLAFVAGAGAAIAASVGVSKQAGFTRLNFMFDQPAKLQIGGGGQNLILNFDQPVGESMPALQPKLADIANGVQQSADGKQVIINLKKNFRTRQFTSGNAVGIDIMNSAAPGASEPKAEVKPEPKPQEQPRDVTSAAPTKTEPLTVIAPPPAASKTKPGDALPPAKPVAKPPVKPSPPIEEPDLSAIKPSAAPKPESAEAEAPTTIRTAPPSVLTTKPVAPPVVVETPAAPVEDKGPPAPDVPPTAALEPVADQERITQPSPSNPVLSTKRETPPIVETTPVEKVAPAKPPLDPAQIEALPDDKPAPIAEPAEKTDPHAEFVVSAKTSKGTTTIDFPWKKRVASAVFERGNDIWAVFSEPVDANTKLLKTVLPKTIIKIDQFAYDGATVLRLMTDGTLHAALRQPTNSYSHKLVLAAQGADASLDIPVTGDKDDDGKSFLLLQAFDVSTPLRFFDPTIGDLLIVIPTFEVGRGIANQKSTPEMTILRTPQGIAIAALRDTLQTLHDRSGVRIYAPAGVAVSQNLPVLAANAAPVPGTSAASSVMIPYDQWYVAPADFIAVRAQRQQAFETASEDAKPEAMEKLMQLYAGQGMMSEALGYLEIMQQDYPNYYRDHKLALIAAAAHWFNDDIPDAQAAINSPELANLPEAELWRQAINVLVPPPQPTLMEQAAQAEKEKLAMPTDTAPGASATAPTADKTEAVEEEEEEEDTDEKPQQPTTATPSTDTADATQTAAPTEPVAATPPPEFRYLDFNKPFIRFYPPRLRQKLAMLAADIYLKNGQPENSLKTYETLNSDGILQPVQHNAELMMARVAADKGKTKDAQEIYDHLAAQQDDRFIQANARYEAIMLRLKAGALTPEEATQQLERLRLTWRGDTLERRMLNTLVDIYQQQKQYDQVLRTWKYLLQSYPDQVDTLTVAGDMTELFENLFLHGEADSMPPLKALGLFYEFRELTPIGDKGDQIIQKLADRLAAVDLLERATQLLEHQIKFRVSGESRARVGARLALLYLLNKNPQRALEVLEITNFGAMPAQLQRQRLQLTAQALAENGKPEEGLNLLFNDNSPEGALLRLDILWGMQDWPNIINTAEDSLADRPNLTDPLTANESQVLLKLALAYSFENDEMQLRYLRDYYSGLLPEGPYKEIFDYITNDTAPLDAEDFALVAKQISHTESFMELFRSKIAAGRLSEAVK